MIRGAQAKRLNSSPNWQDLVRLFGDLAQQFKDQPFCSGEATA
jgi:hypothetical protein